MKSRPLNILVSPLDWGLGHASRLIPIIVQFIKDGHSVIIAGSGRSSDLLRETFPGLKFIYLPSYAVKIGSGKFSYFRLLFRLPDMIRSVFLEHRMLRRIVNDEAVEIVISDNRYGLFSGNAYSVFITHQVSPVLPAFFRWLEYPLYLIIRSLIKRFDQCWIPDFPSPDMSLSGSLSHRFKLPSKAVYIGILSRFSHLNIPEKPKGDPYDVAVILSGPEPQISIFENILCSQLIHLNKSAILLRGMRNNPIPFRESMPVGVRHVTHLEMTGFSQVIKNAGLVLSRSGYTGIMDFITLGIPAVLVPTPGQSEQEYLAEWLSKKGWFTCVKQDELNLAHMNEISFPVKLPLFPRQDFKFLKDLYRENRQNRCQTQQKAGVNL